MFLGGCAQRPTEAIGVVYAAVPPGPDKRVLRVDGAFVPVLHGEWAEVKTLVVGDVGAPTQVDGKPVVATHGHSSCSRVADAHLADLEKRLAQMDDPSFQAAGWPLAVAASRGPTKWWWQRG